MRKRWQLILVMPLLIILVLIFYFFYIYVYELDATPISFIENKTAISDNVNSYSPSLQFYPNLRFPKKEIFYHIQESCNNEKKKRMLQAFSKIEKETPIVFYGNIYEDKADILVTCEQQGEELPGKYFIAGEGGPTSITNNSKFYIIEKGKILLLYSENSCNNYNVELHELLHVLGFEHSSNPNSIMYNTSFCNQQLTQDIIEKLNYIYSIPEMPDLYFSNISAYKHGSYLNFNVEVRNIGLFNSENVKLEVYAKDGDEKKIYEFDLETINYGEGKYLKVENVKMGKANKIKFVLVSGAELDKENNIIELFLP